MVKLLNADTSMSEARRLFHLDKRFVTDEIDTLEYPTYTLIALYAGYQLIVWRQHSNMWVREKYMYDKLCDKTVYR